MEAQRLPWYASLLTSKGRELSQSRNRRNGCNIIAIRPLVSMPWLLRSSDYWQHALTIPGTNLAVKALMHIKCTSEHKRFLAGAMSESKLPICGSCRRHCPHWPAWPANQRKLLHCPLWGYEESRCKCCHLHSCCCPLQAMHDISSLKISEEPGK